MTSRATGAQAEKQAEKFLRKHGLRLLERNFHAKTGEIDLIMEDGELLVFVEVRLRNNPGYGSGADSISGAKQQKIINTAERFLQVNGYRWDSYRFDVVSIGSSVEWIPAAFTLD